MPRKKKNGGGLYQTAMNKLTGSNIGKTEFHAPQIVNGRIQLANYMGPGTDLYANIRNKKLPITKSDKISKAHDLRYDRARTIQEVRNADIKMVSKLKQLKKNKEDSKFNTNMGILPIQLKMWAEDNNLIKKGSFANIKKGVDESDIKLNNSTLLELEKEGYGKKKKKKNPWLEHVKRVRATHPEGTPYKECMKIASKTYKKIK